MYQFPVAALTSYHKLCGLKQHKFIHDSEGQKSKISPHWAKTKVSTELYFFLEDLEKSPFLCPWLLEIACIPWLVALSSIFKTSNNRLCTSQAAISLVLRSHIFLQLFQGPCDCTGSAQLIHDSLAISWPVGQHYYSTLPNLGSGD